MNFWQSKYWEKFQNSLGYKTFRIFEILIIEKKIFFGKIFFEIPRIPKNVPQHFWKKLEKIAREKNAIFARISPNCDNFFWPKGFKIKSTKNERFPQATRIIDLQPEISEVFSQFSSTGRRQIRIAQKNNLTINESFDVNFFTELSSKTANRDGFSAHNFSFFQKFLKNLPTKILAVKSKEKILAAGIFVFFKKIAIYYFGASDTSENKKNAPTFLQFEAMKMAKKMGCEKFDLLGIAPKNSHNHRLAGVSRFKKKFGGVEKNFSRESNLVFQNFWFFIFQVGKLIRKIVKI